MDQDSMPVFVLGCAECGKTVAGSEKSCPRCGASFEDVRFECPFCGELISAEGGRCPACKTEFAVFATEVSEASNVDLDGPEKAESEAKSNLCPRCGQLLTGEGEVCPNCAAEHAEYLCPQCGKTVSENDETCPHCGVKFG